MNFGASQEPARSIRVREQFCARCGNGGKQKQNSQIDRHFIFYRTTSS